MSGTTAWDVEQRLNKKIEEMADEIERLRYIFRVNILRLAPETQHEEIDRILAGEPHH